MAEVYAGFLAHTDAQIGRLLDYLEESGQRENTLVIVVSDNGASGEGGPDGSVNENKIANGIPDDIQENLAKLDELGSPKTYNHYPTGWAMAFNTPFRMWKRYEFNGGTSDPCIISWPAGIAARGEMREQYHHAVDIVPTILDVLGVDPPEAIGGHAQSRFDGVSMRYSFDHAGLPSARAASGTTAGRPSRPTRRSADGATSRRTSGSCTTPRWTARSCTTSPPTSRSACRS
jgi:arylsulfatase